MSEVSWLPEALEDIQRLHRFLAEKSPQAARNAVLCIQAAARQLPEFPEIGRSMPDHSGRREVFAAFGARAYLIIKNLPPRPVSVAIRL